MAHRDNRVVARATNRAGVDPTIGEKAFVLFDLGETLVDLTDLVASLARFLGQRFPALRPTVGELAREWIVRAWQQMPRQEGQPFVPEFEIASAVLTQVLSKNGVELTSTEAGGFLVTAWDDFEPRARFCAGVSESWLRDIKRLSAGLGIVTDGDEENVARLVRRLRLREYFDAVVTSQATHAYKPSPLIYRAALRALDAAPERTIFVSDSPLDLQGANRLGIRPALLGRPLLQPQDRLPDDVIRLAVPQDLNLVLRRFPESGQFEQPGF